jgi:ABC-type transporter Mla MlaB component
MRVYMSGSMANLVGDWSVAGVTQCNLDTLAAALGQINPTSAQRLQVDCRQVEAIDTTGRQILNVWMECVRLRGVEPELVIPSNNLRQIFQSLGLRCRYSSRTTARYTHAPANHRRRRSGHENRPDKGNCQAAQH